MSATSPMTAAAITGPTPKTSVSVVPDARTATATDRVSFGSFLFEVPDDASRTRAPKLGLDIQHLLAGRQQLLGQHVPQAARALDGPGPLRPFRRPFQQFAGLRRGSPDPQLAERRLGRVDRYRGVGSLVRIHADHYRCHSPALSARRSWAKAWLYRSGHV